LLGVAVVLGASQRASSGSFPQHSYYFQGQVAFLARIEDQAAVRIHSGLLGFARDDSSVVMAFSREH